MKSTGIVRKIDELGRVVIPKEVRRILNIKDGDDIEIFVDNNYQLVLKKYSQIKNNIERESTLLKCLYAKINKPCLITDKAQVIAVCGLLKTDYEGINISSNLATLLDNQQPQILNNKGIQIVQNDKKWEKQLIFPFVINENVLGSLIICDETDEMDYALADLTTQIIVGQLH